LLLVNIGNFDGALMSKMFAFDALSTNQPVNQSINQSIMQASKQNTQRHLTEVNQRRMGIKA